MYEAGFERIHLKLGCTLLEAVSEPHLEHLPPLRVQVVVHVVRSEHLRAHAQHGVRVRLPVNQALDDGVLGGQVLGLQQVDAHDALAAAHGSDGK